MSTADELHQASGFLCAGHLGKLLPTQCSQCEIGRLKSLLRSCVLPMVLDTGETWFVDSIAGGADSTDGEPNRLSVRVTTEDDGVPDRVIEYVRKVAAAGPSDRYLRAGGPARRRAEEEPPSDG